MTKTQSFEKSVDSARYVLVTEADACVLRSNESEATNNAKTGIRNGVLKKRSRLLIRLHVNEASNDLFIGGSGVTMANGYPLQVGESIELSVSHKVTVFGFVP